MTDIDYRRLAAELAPRVADALAARGLVFAAPPAPPSQPDDLMSKSALAAVLHRSAATIDRWADAGMPFVDMGSYRLFRRDACFAWASTRPRPGRPVRTSPTSASVPVGGAELRTRARRKV